MVQQKVRWIYHFPKSVQVSTLTPRTRWTAEDRDDTHLHVMHAPRVLVAIAVLTGMGWKHEGGGS